MARNLAVLNRLHPGYDQLIAAHHAADPLADARRRLDMARWRAARRGPERCDGAGAGSGSVLLITHDRGGGVQRLIDARIARLRAAGLYPIVLAPVLLHTEPAYAGLCQVYDRAADGYPNLRFALPRELGLLAQFLRGDRVVRAELHHLLGHEHAVLDLCHRLDVPYDVYIHDYAWFCPRISLLGPDRRYCGEPDVAHCEACVSDAGRNIEEDIPVAALRRRSADDLMRARRVIAPSADTAQRIARHFAGIDPEVVPWETDEPAPMRPAPAPAPEHRICMIGAIGPEKGYDVLLACARDAAARDLNLRFIVVGHTIDDARLLETGRVFITGQYREAEATSLIAAQRAHLAWLPSVWPETWCFALSEAWRAGLDVVAFDIGAPAERIRNSGRGVVLPLGLSPAALNNALQAACHGSATEQRKRRQKAPFTLRSGPAINMLDQPTSARPPPARTESEISACPKPATSL
jgi:glycosyltransferase involved in cell wall biosynthesis